jgi:beta-ureidopropionase
MKIALIQQHATLDENDNLRRGRTAFEDAARNGAELIVYPELAFLPFLPQARAEDRPDALSRAQTVPGPVTDAFSALARRYSVVTVLNLFERDGGRTYDTSPVIDADGTLLGKTRMVHIMDGPGFHETGYYHPGDGTSFVFPTRAGKVGIAICYDRHFPEYMRGLGLLGAEIVVVPQAGILDEWGPGLYEGEIQIASFQNGYFGALCNRVGTETHLHFSGESFVTDPFGHVIARASRDRDEILFADCDLGLIGTSHAKRHFYPDRRPEVYGRFSLEKKTPGR